jgi:hypothetical protein
MGQDTLRRIPSLPLWERLDHHILTQTQLAMILTSFRSSEVQETTNAVKLYLTQLLEDTMGKLENSNVIWTWDQFNLHSEKEGCDALR